ncbi:MAG: sel1 repeat family protein [Rhodospirillaceae bacterium]|jgi:uncharacterized protein|nr:sel1 repeat family protein [Rhodospirillaceae bacterium]
MRKLLLAIAVVLPLAVGGAPVAVAEDPEDSSVSYLAGVLLYANEHYTQAMRVIRPFAEEGEAPAQYIVGNMHNYGWGVVEDDVEAAKWYRKAAEQGHAHAQSSLAILYKYGSGVAQNHAEAAKWYRKAAEQGEASGQSDTVMTVLWPFLPR